MMFSSKNPKAISESGGSATIIGSAVVLTGDIKSTADIRIDGTVVGNVTSAARVLVGPEGLIEGNVESEQADIAGKVKGIVKTKELLSLKGNAVITGDVFTGKLHVEPTATFNGHCYMTGNVIEMMNEANEKRAAAAK